MGKTVKVILYKRKKDDLHGVIMIRSIQNRKKTDFSLSIRIEEQFWNANKQRVRQSADIDYKSYNEAIEKALKKYNSEPEELKPIVSDKSFIAYFKNLHEKAHHITAKKYQTVITTLEKYHPDLLFKEINHDWLEKFQIYLSKTKGLKQNTSNRYLIVMKSVVNKAIKSDQYDYLKHPFRNFKFPDERKKETYLTSDEVKKLINTEVPENLRYTKLQFLFQIFCNGIRVSDMLLQRWINIKENRLHFTIYKGKKKEASILINSNLLAILSEVILINPEFEILEGYQELKQSDLDLKEHLLTLSDKPVKIGLEKLKAINKIHDVSERIEKEKQDDEDKALEGFKYFKNKFTVQILKKISHHKDFKHRFIFPALKEKDFIKYDIKNTDKSHIQQIEAKTTLYNRNLKLIGDLIETNTVITSHVARSTFANLLLSNDADIYTISKSLYHSNLKITERYVRKFNDVKVDADIEKLIDKFNI